MNIETCHPEIWAIWEVARSTKDEKILQQVLIDLEKLDAKIVGATCIIAVKLYATNKQKNPRSYPD